MSAMSAINPIAPGGSSGSFRTNYQRGGLINSPYGNGDPNESAVDFILVEGKRKKKQKSPLVCKSGVDCLVKASIQLPKRKKHEEPPICRSAQYRAYNALDKAGGGIAWAGAATFAASRPASWLFPQGGAVMGSLGTGAVIVGGSMQIAGQYGKAYAAPSVSNTASAAGSITLGLIAGRVTKNLAVGMVTGTIADTALSPSSDGICR